MNGGGPQVYGYAGGAPFVNVDPSGRLLSFRFSSSLTYVQAGFTDSAGAVIGLNPSGSTFGSVDPNVAGFVLSGHCRRCGGDGCTYEFDVQAAVAMPIYILTGTVHVDRCGRTTLQHERAHQSDIVEYLLGVPDPTVGFADEPTCDAAREAFFRGGGATLARMVNEARDFSHFERDLSFGGCGP